jgi:PadR family transcriptional regulator PadR
MREPTLWILTAPVDRPRHGYGVMREAETLSAGQIRLQPGTLYAALDRLTAQGLVDIDREEIVDGRPRQYYRLTDDGTSALAAQSKRLIHDAGTTSQRSRAFRPATRLGPAAVTLG